MARRKLIGLVMPDSADLIPPEAPAMYPHIDFVARGIALRSLSPAGYAEAIERIVPAARDLAARGAAAVMVVGTSLTFCRGAQFNEQLIGELAAATQLPASTMSTAIVAALRAVGARRLAAVTAYSEDVNRLLLAFLAQHGFEVASLHVVQAAAHVGEAARIMPRDIVDVSLKAHAEAAGADGLLIVCGGLRTLEITALIEQRCGVPVVSSMPAALWAAARLAGDSGRAGPGHGRLLDHVATHAWAPATTSSFGAPS